MSDFRLMIPGPVDSEDDVLSALAEPTLPHYGPLFMPLFNETTELLKDVFQTQNDVLMMPGPGTGSLEAAIGSLVTPGNSAVVVTNGHFGRRANHIVGAFNFQPIPITFPMGAVADPAQVREQIKDALKAGHKIDALVLTHHETSTGVVNPIRELAAVGHEFDIPIVVDAVASLGGVELKVDEWGLDACISVPNKCLAAVPGLGLMTVSPRVWEIAQKNPGKHGWYYDLRTWAVYRDEWAEWHPYPTTLPTNIIVALHQALLNVLDYGLDAWIASHAETANRVREGMFAMGFTMFPDEAYASPTITAFNTRADVDLASMTKTLLQEHHIAISGGLDELKGRIFRVGHMGKARHADYTDAFLGAVRAYLETTGLPVGV